jgi:hypothetical protein
MPKTKISEFSATPASNTDIDSIFIGEGMAPSNVNDAIRELMAQLKDFQVGSAGDPVTVGGVLTVQAGAVGTPAITTAGDTNTGIFFPAADTIAFAEGGVEAMRLDSSGNMGIGTSSPDQALVVNKASGSTYLKISGANNSANDLGLQFTDGTNTSFFGQLRGTLSGTAGALACVTGGAIRTVVDSSGNLLVGTTSGSSRLVVSGTNAVATFTSSSTSAQINIQAANSSGANSRIYMECPGINAGGFGYVRSTSRLYAWNATEDSGPYIVANGTSWTTNSDARLKTNVQNLGYGLTSVLALLPKEYEYKVDEGKKCLGFIAQDVIAVIPELVDAPEDSNEMMGIEYQSFIPVLVKAIQEQQAIIENLKARLDAANL